MTGVTIDPRAIVADAAADTSGVPHAAALLRFAEALVNAGDAALAAARLGLRAELGDAALVDAAAVASNFERMVRIADGTGIPLDAPVAALAADLQRDLGLGRFASAANTPPPGLLARAAGGLLRPLAAAALRFAGRVQRARRLPR